MLLRLNHLHDSLLDRQDQGNHDSFIDLRHKDSQSLLHDLLMDLYSALSAPQSELDSKEGQRQLKAHRHNGVEMPSKTLAKFTDTPVSTKRDFSLAQAAVDYPTTT